MKYLTILLTSVMITSCALKKPTAPQDDPKVIYRAVVDPPRFDKFGKLIPLKRQPRVESNPSAYQVYER